MNKISDEFEIEIGESDNSGKFICGRIRKGAVHPEPFDAHRIGDWIIQEFGLKYNKKYTIKITVTRNESVNDKP